MVDLAGTEGQGSAVVACRYLARQFQRLRKDAGMTQAGAAKAFGWSPRKQQLLEAGDQAISARELDVILPALGVAEAQRDQWHAYADAAQSQGWWDKYPDAVLPPSSKRYIGYEQGATKMRAFVPLVINGLFQTPSYRAAILRDAAVTPRPGEQVNALVEISWLRQQALLRSTPLVVHAVLDEAAVRRRVGSPEVMSDQLDHLASLAEHHDHITVQVIPFDAGPHAGLGGAFTLVEFGLPDDPGFVYIEGGPDHTSYLEGLDDIYLYSQIFDRLGAQALAPDESIDMLRRLAEDRKGTAN